MRFIALLLAGCAAPVAPLVVRSVEWNPAGANVGRAVAVADTGSEQLLVGARATLLSSGAMVGQAVGPEWRSAASIPAADGNGRWLVAVAADGSLVRLRSGGRTESVGERFGLGAAHVREVCATDGAAVFRVDGAVVVAAGATARRWPVDGITALACGKTRIAAADRTGVRVWPVDGGPGRRYEAHAQSVAFAGDRLAIATGDTLFVEGSDGTLTAAHRGQISAVTAAGERLWFLDGNRLGSLDHGDLALCPKPLDNTGSLFGASDGGVWVLGTRVARYQRDERALAGDERWQTLVAPVFARSCSRCHLPGGKSGIDLSTERAWKARHDDIRQRVVVDRDMPPSSAPLSEADRKQLATWLTR